MPGCYAAIHTQELIALSQIRHSWLQNQVLCNSYPLWLSFEPSSRMELMQISSQRLLQLDSLLEQEGRLFSPVTIMNAYGLFQSEVACDLEMRRQMERLYSRLIDLGPKISVCKKHSHECKAALSTLERNPLDEAAYSAWLRACESLLDSLNALPKGAWLP